MDWKLEKRKLSELTEWENNPRRLLKDKLDDLEKSISKFGCAEPLVINTDGTICGGHGRKKILERLKIKEVDCYVPGRTLTDQEFKELNVRLNKNIAGEFDFDILANCFEVDDLLDWGFSAEELDIEIAEDEIEIVEDEPPEIDEAEDTITEPGRVYQLGKHRLMCGSSTEASDVEKLMNGEEADLVVTDPPYNVDYQGGTDEKLKIINDSMGDKDFYNFLYDFYKLVFAHLKKGGCIYVAHADSEGANFRQAMKDAGLLLKQCIIWIKNSSVLSRQDYNWKHEPILYGWKPGEAHYFCNDFTKTTVIDDDVDITKLGKQELLDMVKKFQELQQESIIRIDKPNRNGEHPTMKPVKLFAELIQNSSQPDEIVLDLFGGSGTTLIASEQTGRQSRIMELDPKYCDVIVRRYCNFRGIDADEVFKTGIAE